MKKYFVLLLSCGVLNACSTDEMTDCSANHNYGCAPYGDERTAVGEQKISFAATEPAAGEEEMTPEPAVTEPAPVAAPAPAPVTETTIGEEPAAPPPVPDDSAMMKKADAPDVRGMK